MSETAMIPTPPTDLATSEAAFLAASEVEAGPTRERVLDEYCADDPAMRARVVALIEAAEGASEEFLPEERPRKQREAAEVDVPGMRIGPYLLCAKLGEGGFGTVWRAEQLEPIQRAVALKLIREGQNQQEVIKRFESERQVLALLNHQNIAAVLDAGATVDGRPYFVMELVDGLNIAEHCKRYQLTIRQRIDLFLQVCGAVQHAHQKGLLHRDLKPANVLVTMVDGFPVAKVIDFGIAKAVSGDGMGHLRVLPDQTLGLHILGTPQYMSPEQAGSARDIDTRSDIYSLGILLYELLTGHTPLEPEHLGRAAIDEVLRLVRECEPVRPSTRVMQRVKFENEAETKQVRRELSGDLDWIVLKALEKDRDRRFVTVNSFAEDLRAFLQNDVVAARPPSLGYRLQKLAKKHRTAFLSVLAVADVIVASLVVSLFALVREKRALNAEEAARKRAERMLHFFTNMLHDQVELVSTGKNPEVLRLALDRSTARVHQLKDDPEATNIVSGLIARLFRNIDDKARSVPVARLRLVEAEANYGEFHPLTLEARVAYGRVLNSDDQYQEALVQLDKAIAEYEKTERTGLPLYIIARRDRLRAALGTGALKPSEISAVLQELQQDLADVAATPDDELAMLHLEAELYYRSELWHEAAVPLRRIVDGKTAKEPSHMLMVQSLTILGECEKKMGRVSEAVRYFRRAIQEDIKGRGQDYLYLADRHILLAAALEESGQIPDALLAMREAVRIRRVNGSMDKVRTALRDAAMMALRHDDYVSAEPLLAEALQLQKEADPSGTAWIDLRVLQLSIPAKQRQVTEFAKETRMLLGEVKSLHPQAAIKVLDLLKEVQPVAEIEGLRDEVIRLAMRAAAQRASQFGLSVPDAGAVLELAKVLHRADKRPEAAVWTALARDLGHGDAMLQKEIEAWKKEITAQ